MPVYAPADILWEGRSTGPGYALHVTAEGRVLSLSRASAWMPDQVKVLPGVIVPGMVNAHCHLELSHLKGKIPEGTGMTGFIQAIQSVRNDSTEAEREAALAAALQQAWEAGISGFGDICNGTSTLALKAAWQPRMAFHSFLELFGLNPGRAAEMLEQGRTLRDAFPPGTASLTPHAPYSVSSALRDLLYAEPGQRLSIHLMESEEERMLFAQHSGPFLDFYARIGAAYPGGDARSATAYITRNLPARPVLWVHNAAFTPADTGDLALLAQPGAWLVLCPRANAYIHRSLPPALLWERFPARICLGTDSLASNHSLDLLAEMQTLQSAYPGLSTETLMRWGTLHGAQALGFDHLGSLHPFAQPGIVHIPGLPSLHTPLSDGCQAVRLH